MKRFKKIIFGALVLWVGTVLSYDDSVKLHRTEKRIKETGYTLKDTPCYQLYLEKKFNEAMKVCQQLASKDDSEAQYLIARMYWSGQGVEKNNLIARDWYFKAAENGQVNAQKMVAAMYYMGVGVKQSMSKAHDWYTRVAKQNDKEGQFMVGVYYRTLAQKDPSNYSKMWYWLKKSAAQNYTPAFYVMSECYYVGIGTDVNDRKAFSYMKKAADGGWWQAYFPLGKMYEYGHGVKLNLKKALYWYKKSADTKQGRAAAYKVMLLSPDL